MDKKDELSIKLAAEQAGIAPLRFDFGLIKEALERLPQMRLSRIPAGSKDTPDGRLSLLLRLLVHVSSNTWDSVKFLGRNELNDGRRTEFSFSIPPLTRTLLESLFTVVFVLEKPAERTRWFFLYGWADTLINYREMKARYGADPEWKTWLEVKEEGDVKQLAEMINPTQDEEDHPDQIAWWPTPGKRIKKTDDATRKAFLEFLHERFYGYLSSDAHLSLPGLLRRGGPFLKLLAGVDRADLHLRTRSKFVFECLSIYVALLTEICGPSAPDDEKAQLRSIWEQVKVLEDAEELYRNRYEAWLRQPQ